MPAPITIYATIIYQAEGHTLAIWSAKAKTWVRLANRYVKLKDAQRAIETYGFQLVSSGTPPC